MTDNEVYTIGYTLLFAINAWMVLTTEHLIVILGCSLLMCVSGVMLVCAIANVLDGK